MVMMDSFLVVDESQHGIHENFGAKWWILQEWEISKESIVTEGQRNIFNNDPIYGIFRSKISIIRQKIKGKTINHKWQFSKKYNI